MCPNLQLASLYHRCQHLAHVINARKIEALQGKLLRYLGSNDGDWGRDVAERVMKAERAPDAWSRSRTREAGCPTTNVPGFRAQSASWCCNRSHSLHTTGRRHKRHSCNWGRRSSAPSKKGVHSRMRVRWWTAHVSFVVSMFIPLPF